MKDIKFLDYVEANEKLGLCKLAEISDIGKMAAANILKIKKKIHKQHEQFHHKNNAVNLGNRSLSMTLCMTGTKNVAPWFVYKRSSATRRDYGN